MIAKAANYLGLAIAGMINILDLEYVIVGGGMAQMGELLLGPIRAATKCYALSDYRDPVPIVGPALGGDAGAIGAAWAVQIDGLL